MLIRNSEHVYMIDRDNTVFAVRGLKFPSRKNLDDTLRNTLVDGVRQQKINLIKPKIGKFSIATFLCCWMYQWSTVISHQEFYILVTFHCITHESIFTLLCCVTLYVFAPH